MTPTTQSVVVPDPLWMMHVIGPDDIYPAPDHATAVQWCAYLNREIAPRVPEVLCVAVPAIWTGTAEEHAEGLAEAIKGWAVPTAPAPSSLASGEVDAAVEHLTKRLNKPGAFHLGDEPHLRAILAALSPEAPAREVEVYDKFKAPIGSTVWIKATVTDNCTSCCSVVIDAIHGKMHLTVVPSDVALTPRHEAPASPTERELDLLDAVMRAGGIVKTAAALPDKAAHLSLLTDALNRADAILTEGLNGAPVSHEAPAEGAGERDAVTEIAVSTIRWAMGRGDDLRDYKEPLEHVLDAALRARSSAPEAREGEAVAWRSRQRIMSYSEQPGVWNYGESRTLPDDDPVYENQPLFTHPAAPSADKLRIAVEALLTLPELKKRQEHLSKGIGTATDEGKIVLQALAALKAKGAK